MKNHFASLEMNPIERTWGSCYWLVMVCALPQILPWVNHCLPHPMSEGQLNFTFYFINFLACLCIFHRYVLKALDCIRRNPIAFIQSLILALVAYYAFFYGIRWFIRIIAPEFRNANDTAISHMARADRFLTVMGTVILAPFTEELLYRGLLFGSLIRRHPVAAYGVSSVVFALIHVLGYWGSLSPLHIFLSILQYLPAGIWLAWSCAKSGSVATAIVMHALINWAAIYYSR